MRYNRPDGEQLNFTGVEAESTDSFWLAHAAPLCSSSFIPPLQGLLTRRRRVLGQPLSARLQVIVLLWSTRLSLSLSVTVLSEKQTRGW
jgi:hypothetical protein